MKLRILGALTLVATIVVIPTAASAKGITTVTVSGPHLHQPIQLGDGTAANNLAEQAGVFVAFSVSTTGLLHSGPSPAERGPRYLATYQFLVGPDGQTAPLRQDLYPFARGGAVTYTPPGQHLFDNQSPLPGGWFAAGPRLTALLIADGLPNAPATQPARSHPAAGGPTTWIAAIAVAGVVVVAAVIAAITRRRRHRCVADLAAFDGFRHCVDLT